MVVRCKIVVDMTRSVSSIFVIKWPLDDGWPMLKHGSLSKKMRFPKVQFVFKLDHFLETMEMKSLKSSENHDPPPPP